MPPIVYGRAADFRASLKLVPPLTRSDSAAYQLVQLKSFNLKLIRNLIISGRVADYKASSKFVSL